MLLGRKNGVIGYDVVMPGRLPEHLSGQVPSLHVGFSGLVFVFFSDASSFLSLVFVTVCLEIERQRARTLRQVWIKISWNKQ